MSLVYSNLVVSCIVVCEGSNLFSEFISKHVVVATLLYYCEKQTSVIVQKTSFTLLEGDCHVTMVLILMYAAT